MTNCKVDYIGDLRERLELKVLSKAYSKLNMPYCKMNPYIQCLNHFAQE